MHARRGTYATGLMSGLWGHLHRSPAMGLSLRTRLTAPQSLVLLLLQPSLLFLGLERLSAGGKGHAGLQHPGAVNLSGAFGSSP